MAIKVDFNFRKEVSSLRGIEETFRYLCDWETAIPTNFPGLVAFEKTDAATYRWRFQKLAHSGYELQLQFVTKFISISPDKIEMQSAPGEKSGVRGQWRLSSQGTTTRIHFELQLSLELPLPFLFKAVVAPLAQKELGRLFDRYLSNVENTLST